MLQAFANYPHLKDVIERCNQVVVDTLKKNTIQEANIALESFGNGGKRLRPMLLILSSMVPDGSGFEAIDESLIELAGAVELVHLATLFHDDVIDGVDNRRTKVSARIKYGNYASILTGDFALAEALAMVQRSQHSATMPEFIRTLRVLVRGESLETAHKFDFGLSKAQYYDIISEKSASLFALSCKVGGMTRGFQYSDTLGHFGWSLGMAFQMIDDLDDMLSTPNHSNDCDLENGYICLPLIHLLDRLKDGHREHLVDIINNADFSPDNERFIVSLCLEHDAISHTREEIHKHLVRARESIERFDPSEARGLLERVVNGLDVYSENQVKNFSVFTRSAG